MYIYFNEYISPTYHVTSFYNYFKQKKICNSEKKGAQRPNIKKLNELKAQDISSEITSKIHRPAKVIKTQ